MNSLKLAKTLTECFIKVSRRRKQNFNEELSNHLRDTLILAQQELDDKYKADYEAWHQKKFKFDW